MATPSWRLSVQEVDQSQSVRPVTNNVGATVVIADKGSEEPVYIERGNTQEILNLFGKPTSSKPQIFEALKYNEEAPIWISAPSKSGRYGGVFVTKTGTEAFTYGFSAKTSINFASITVVETLGTGDDSTNTFSSTLSDYIHYNNQSVVIKIDDTTLTNYNVTNAATEIITADEINNGSYVRSTGALSVTFKSAPANGEVVTATYTVDRSDDVYFILFNKNPQVDDLAVKTTFNSSDTTFSIQLYIKDADTSAYSELVAQGSPYTVSLTEGTKDGFNNNIYITDVFEDSNYITPVINTSLTVSTFQVDTDQLELAGIGDGSTKTFSYTLQEYSTYENQSIDITVNGTTINVSASNAATEILTTTPNVGSGTLVRSTGLLSFTFTSAPAVDALIRADYDTLEATDPSQVDMAGGYRGTTPQGADLIRGWDYFDNETTYPADIFFDVSANPNIPSKFSTLRNTYQEYKAYILPLPQENSTDAIATKTSYGIADRGIYYYWNRFKIRNAYNDDSIWTPCTGAIAKKHAQMVDVFNGLAPAWIDENNHGGQLDVQVLEQAYGSDENTLRTLDQEHINPIHNDITYGPLIKSQRTSLTVESDYSYIGHSRTADYIISNVVDQVLPFQFVKLNDTFHRARVKANTENIINPLAGDPYNLLRDFAVVCDQTNNTDEVLAKRQFILTVYVKFTPFSEEIVFYFINTAQGTDIDELVGG